MSELTKYATLCPSCAALQAELTVLRARCEAAERERDEARQTANGAENNRKWVQGLLDIAEGERDEARALLGELADGLKYAAEVFAGYGMEKGRHCDCRMSGSGGCFEQCPLHAALSKLPLAARAEAGALRSP